jgi:hypothetical protein
MKASCLSLTLIACAVLIHGISYAFSPGLVPEGQSESSTKSLSGNDAKARTERRHDERNHRHDSDKNHARSHRNSSKANSANQRRNSQKRFTSANGTRDRQPGREGFNGVAARGSIPDPRNDKVRGRFRDGARHTALTLNTVRHRGSNPAAIGGSTAGNRGKIDGTGVHRKP